MIRIIGEQQRITTSSQPKSRKQIFHCSGERYSVTYTSSKEEG